MEMVVASDTINVTLADPLVVTLDSTNITCNGLTDGTATATVVVELQTTLI